MDEKDKKYFNNLVGSDADSENEDEEELTEEEEEFEDEEELAEEESEEEVEPAVELIKSSSVASKSKAKSSRSSVSLNTSNDDSEDFYGEAEGQLTVDVFQNEDEIVIQSTIAGVTPDKLNIDITSETVTIKGHRLRHEDVRDEDFFYQECYWGRFSRSVILPQEIDPDKADAKLKDGILTIRLPKLNKNKAKRVKVKIS